MPRHLARTLRLLGLAAMMMSRLPALVPSAQPPGGLASETVPQFVLLGFDDNPSARELTWLLDLLERFRNPAGAGRAATFDGTRVRAIFYSNGKYWGDAAVVAAHRRAFAAGHEIANHTQNHEHGLAFTAADWERELTACDRVFAGAGIPAGAIRGFRTPFLQYNDATFTALTATHRLYDTSIEEGFQPDQDGTNFLWPYTLENGSPGNTVRIAADSPRRVGGHAGLWEIPLCAFVVPADADCAALGAKPGIRQRIHDNLLKQGSDWSVAEGKITGLDWNVLEGARTDGDDLLAILKHTLDLRLKGNRAPFMVGGHTALYPPASPDRRRAMEEFLAYALAKPEVRIVTAGQLIQWLEHPVALGAAPR